MQWKEQLTIFHAEHKYLCAAFDFFWYAKLFLALFVCINHFPVLCLLHNKMIQSFSNSGRPHDNAVAESFFASFKREELYRKNYSSEKEFKQGVDSYITFYNQQRPHRTLRNKTPNQVEIEFAYQQPDMWGVRIPSFTRLHSNFELFAFNKWQIMSKWKSRKVLTCQGFAAKNDLT